jgi:molybdenum cofactor biosynthesis protein B
MTDGDHGQDHSHATGDGEHAPAHVTDSERGHDHHATDDDGEGHSNTTDGHERDTHHADDATAVGVAVVTVSSTRTLDEDASGDAIVAALEDAGHEISTRELVQDDFDGVQATVAQLTKRDDVDVVVTTGGTGVSPDDVTPEAVEPLFDKHLPGFGEAFRRRSMDEVGPIGMVSRATAGTTNGTVVAVLPGSESAARTGVSLLEPVLGHLVGLAAHQA